MMERFAAYRDSFIGCCKCVRPAEEKATRSGTTSQLEINKSAIVPSPAYPIARVLTSAAKSGQSKDRIQPTHYVCATVAQRSPWGKKWGVSFGRRRKCNEAARRQTAREITGSVRVKSLAANQSWAAPCSAPPNGPHPSAGRPRKWPTKLVPQTGQPPAIRRLTSDRSRDNRPRSRPECHCFWLTHTTIKQCPFLRDGSKLRSQKLNSKLENEKIKDVVQNTDQTSNGTQNEHVVSTQQQPKKLDSLQAGR